jgi:hypothetical protein
MAILCGISQMAGEVEEVLANQLTRVKLICRVDVIEDDGEEGGVADA